MNSVLFGLVMLGVGWLVIWLCFDHSKPSGTWWPFDLRDNEPAPPAAGDIVQNRRVRSNRHDPKRAWQRSGS